MKRPTGRLRAALPGLRPAAAGTLGWGLVVGACALFDIAHWEDGRRIAAIAGLFALGAALAFAPALFLARLVAPGADTGRRFAAFFLACAAMTAGITALLLTLHRLADVAALHEEGFSHMSGAAFFYTAAGALYEFAVLGLRLYFPYGLAMLFALSLWFAAKPR